MSIHETVNKLVIYSVSLRIGRSPHWKWRPCQDTLHVYWFSLQHTTLFTSIYTHSTQTHREASCCLNWFLFLTHVEEIFTTSVIIHKEGTKIFYEEGTNIVMTTIERYDKQKSKVESWMNLETWTRTLMGLSRNFNNGLIQFRRKCLTATNLWTKSNNGLQIKNRN